MKQSKRFGMRIAMILSAILMLFSTVIAACSPTTPPDGGDVAVESVEITNGDRKELSVGGTVSLVAKVLPLKATDKSVTWVSSDTEVATVSVEGLVTAKAVGSSTVTVTTTDGEFTDEILIVVVEGSSDPGDDPTTPDDPSDPSDPGDEVKVTGITLNKSTHSIEVGDTYTLVATVAPANATNKAVTWKSNATARLTVDENGVVTAKAKGKAIVTVTTVDGQFEAKCTFTITAEASNVPAAVRVTSVTLDKTTLSLESGTTGTLVATVMPANADNKNVFWESSSYMTASVSTEGVVMGIYAGTATITARTEDGDFIATCTVTVTETTTPDPPDNPDNPDEPVYPEYDYPGQPDWTETQEMQLGLHYNNGYMNGISGVTTRDYDASVFRINETKNPSAADPMVLEITQEDSPYYGKYVMYGTFATTSFHCYVSEDLVDWEFGGLCFMPNQYSWGVDTLWAPECIYDPNDGLYYFFYSAHNRYDRELGYNLQASKCLNLNVAVSESPVGPFLEWNEYELRQQCKAEGREPTTAELKDALSSSRFDWRQFLKYDLDKEANGMQYFTSIDSSPFIDPKTGKKYLTFVRDSCQTIGKMHTWPHLVEMENWRTPIYSTLTKMIGTDDGGYEISGNSICEGPSLHYREENDTYYVIISANKYQNSTYCAAQAIWKADGGNLSTYCSNKSNRFKKIHMNDGGLLVYANDNDQASGTGHGVLLHLSTGKICYAYHRHSNKLDGNREYAIDEVHWINYKGQDIMHLNGCSAVMMPRIEGEYENLADKATVTVSSGTGKEALNDGLLNMHDENNTGVWDWIPSFSTSAASTTITYTFDNWYSVAGFTVYNSREKANVFTGVKKVEMKAMMNGRETTIVINDLAVDPDTVIKRYANGTTGAYVTLGSGAYASFEELIVNEISFTIEKPGSKDVHITDIAVFGRTTPADPTFNDLYNPKAYLKMHRYTRPQTSTENAPKTDTVYADGVFDEEIYASQSWYTHTTSVYNSDMGEAKAIGQMGTQLRATSVYGENGVYFAFEVKNTTVYIDTTHLNRGTHLNSGLQLYIGFSNAVLDGDTMSYEIDVDATGYTHIRKHYASNTGTGNPSYNFPPLGVAGAGKIFDKNGNPASVNTAAATGYTIEVYFPWELFDLDGAPASVKMDIAITASSGQEDTKRIGWYSLANADAAQAASGEPTYNGWLNSAKHWHWGTQGWMAGKVDVEIADYDTDMGTVTASPMSFDINGNTTITVESKEGYELRQLLINGEDVTPDIVNNQLVLNKYCDYQKIKVEALFKQEDANAKTVSGVLKSKGGAATFCIPEGTSIKFESDTDVVYATVGKEGTYSVKLSAGIYNLTIAGFEGSYAFEVADTNLSNENYSAFNLPLATSAEPLVKDTWIDCAGTTNKIKLDINLDDFTFIYTMKPAEGQNIATAYDGIGLDILGVAQMQVGFIYDVVGGVTLSTTSFLVRWTAGGNWSNANLSSNGYGMTYSKYETEGVTLMLRVKDGTFNQYYLHNGEWKQAGKTLTGIATGYSLNLYHGQNYISEYKLYAGELPVETTVVKNGTGEVSMNTLYLGGDTVINVAAGSGQELQSLKIGKDAASAVESASLVVDGKYTLTGYNFTTLYVGATFGPITTKYAVSGTMQAQSGVSGLWNIPQGTPISFTNGTLSYAAVVGANGAYSVQLPNGTWTATSAAVPYVFTGSVTVNGAAVANADLQATVTMFTKSSFDFSNSADIASTNSDSVMSETVSFQVTNFDFTFTVKADAGSTLEDLKDGLAISLVGVRGTDSSWYGNLALQFGKIESNGYLTSRWCNKQWGQVDNSISVDDFIAGVQFKLTKRGDTYDAYYWNGTSWVSAVKTSITQTGFTGLCFKAWKNAQNNVSVTNWGLTIVNA